MSKYSHVILITVITFIQYSYLPWLLINLYQKKYNSWIHTVPAYGMLLSSLKAGKFIGETLMKLKKFSNIWLIISFFVLISSFIGTCFITRYSFVMYLYFSMGISGGILTDVSINIDSSASSIVFNKTIKNDDVKNYIEKNLISFTFLMLLSGYLYNPNPLIQFPLLNLAILTGSVFSMILMYYLLINRVINIKKKIILSSSISSDQLSKNKYNNQPIVKPTKEHNNNQQDYKGLVPLNFLSACYGNQLKAQNMYGKMLKWRIQYDVDDIFDTPQDLFHTILKYYPHAIHGYSLDGCAVVYEVLGKGNLPALKKTGMSLEQLVWHFALRNELVFEKLLDPTYMKSILQEGSPTAQAIELYNKQNPLVIPNGCMDIPVKKLMTVLDVGGISISSVNTDVISFIKRSGELIDNYYPEQVKRLVVCNAPRWFSTIWTIIAKVLPESVQKKVDILYDMKGLDKYIHPSQRPVYYGGTDVDLGFAPGHLAFLELEKKWNEKIKQQNDELEKIEKNKLFIKSQDKSENIKVLSHNNEKNITTNHTGLFGWFRNNKVPVAYLGEKNSYRYNPITKTWDMEIEFIENKTADRRNNNRKQAINNDDDNESNSSRSSDDDDDDDDDALNSIDHNIEYEYEDIETAISFSKTNNKYSNISYQNNKTKHIQNTTSSSTMNNNNKSISPIRTRHSSADKKGKMSQEQLEEHGLVLAIQAAHLAANFSKYNSNSIQGTSSNTSSGPLSLSTSQPYLINNELNSIDNMNTNSGKSNHTTESDSLNNNKNNSEYEGDKAVSTKISAALFLLVLSLYIFSQWVYISLVTLIPVWLVIPTSAGGLDYNVRDVALVLSATSLVLLVVHNVFNARFDHVLKASPVRTLRMGCGLLLVVLFLLPWFLCNHYHIDGNINLEFNPLVVNSITTTTMNPSNPTIATTTASNVKNNLMYDIKYIRIFDKVLNTQSPINAAHHDGADHHNIAPKHFDYVNWINNRRYYPSHSFISIFIPSILLSALAIGVYICRKASSVLLYLTLATTFTAPKAIRSAINCFIDIGGPTLSCFLFALGYSQQLKYPLDGSCFLAGAGCMILLVYIESVFLTVQFRGDYGIMTDYQELLSYPIDYSMNTNNNNNNNNNSNNYNSYYIDNNPINNSSEIRQRINNNVNHQGFHLFNEVSIQNNNNNNFLKEDVFCIPLGDINLLFSPIFSGYGSKLYNLKDDFKDL